MNIKELRQTDLIILEYIKGSTLYGTNIPSSDIDIGGIYRVPNSDWLSMESPLKEIGDEKGDEKYFELKRFMELANTANPTVLESLFIPDELIKILKPQAELLIKHGEMFITKKCYWSYSGYATAQIKKAKGKNKKVHSVSEFYDEEQCGHLRDLLYSNLVSKEWIDSRFNKAIYLFLIKGRAKPNAIDSTDWKEMDKHLSKLSKLKCPSRSEFCYKVSTDFELRNWNPWALESIYNNCMPFRPKSMTDFELERFDCSSVEHMSGVYRLYKNGKGIFKKEQLVFTSIPKEREWDDFSGVMFFNEDEYTKQKKAWLSFYEWMANRNEDRWQDKQGNGFDFDHKNMQHTVRLLMEAEKIATMGKPEIRFGGKELLFLREIREGKFNYDYLLKWAEDKCSELKEIYENSSLPDQVNMKKSNELYIELLNM